MELAIISLFGAAILASVLLQFSILYALAAGLLLFMLYGIKKGFSLPELLKMALNGIKTAKNVLITFFLIGILTALWRASGTIPTIIVYASRLMQPSVVLLMSFWLNCMVSLLTGTAFGTAATMGVICATMAAAMQIPPFLVGGAVLAGAFFGDRCSPLSTSALLVSELTGTNIFRNIRAMLRSALLPFLLSSLLYLLIGFRTVHSGEPLDLAAIFAKEFRLHLLALLPAVLILILSACKIHVKLAMSASILCAIPIALLLQQETPLTLLHMAVFGYAAKAAEAAPLVNGGGILSMVKVASIVCLSSSYSDIFRQTGLLEGLKSRIAALSGRITSYGATLCVSVLVGMLACNQTLAIMLTHQLCRDSAESDEAFALYLEDSAVVTSPLIPWSIACALPLSIVGAPVSSFLMAFFLYLLPLFQLCGALRRRGIGDPVS